ncbi:MAG: hypothetical protein SGCHY_004479 [Lobulomycetales sp.]
MFAAIQRSLEFLNYSRPSEDVLEEHWSHILAYYENPESCSHIVAKAKSKNPDDIAHTNLAYHIASLAHYSSKSQDCLDLTFELGVVESLALKSKSRKPNGITAHVVGFFTSLLETDSDLLTQARFLRPQLQLLQQYTESASDMEVFNFLSLIRVIVKQVNSNLGLVPVLLTYTDIKAVNQPIDLLNLLLDIVFDQLTLAQGKSAALIQSIALDILRLVSPDSVSRVRDDESLSSALEAISHFLTHGSKFCEILCAHFLDLYQHMDNARHPVHGKAQCQINFANRDKLIVWWRFIQNVLQASAGSLREQVTASFHAVLLQGPISDFDVDTNDNSLKIVALHCLSSLLSNANTEIGTRTLISALVREGDLVSSSVSAACRIADAAIHNPDPSVSIPCLKVVYACLATYNVDFYETLKRGEPAPSREELPPTQRNALEMYTPHPLTFRLLKIGNTQTDAFTESSPGCTRYFLSARHAIDAHSSTRVDPDDSDTGGIWLRQRSVPEYKDPLEILMQGVSCIPERSKNWTTHLLLCLCAISCYDDDEVRYRLLYHPQTGIPYRLRDMIQEVRERCKSLYSYDSLVVQVKAGLPLAGILGSEVQSLAGMVDSFVLAQEFAREMAAMILLLEEGIERKL